MPRDSRRAVERRGGPTGGGALSGAPRAERGTNTTPGIRDATPEPGDTSPADRARAYRRGTEGRPLPRTETAPAPRVYGARPVTRDREATVPGRAIPRDPGTPPLVASCRVMARPGRRLATRARGHLRPASRLATRGRATACQAAVRRTRRRSHRQRPRHPSLRRLPVSIETRVIAAPLVRRPETVRTVLAQADRSHQCRSHRRLPARLNAPRRPAKARGPRRRANRRPREHNRAAGVRRVRAEAAARSRDGGSGGHGRRNP